MRGGSGALLSLSWLVILSCGGQSTTAQRDTGDEPPSGTRLRAVTLESASGVGVFQYFEDTELDLFCNFVAIDRSTWRCLPAGPATRRVPQIVYIDAACTEPAAALYRSTLEGPFDCTPPRHIVAGGDCGTTPEVFEIVSQVSSRLEYRLVNGVCAQSVPTLDTTTILFAATKVALQAFELGRLNAGAETGGIVPLDVSNDEGASVPVGFRDAAEGFACRLDGSDDDSRCVPAELGNMGYVYADSGCTEKAANLTICPAERSEILFAYDRSSDTYHRGGPRLDVVYAGSTTNCSSSTYNGFGVGPPVPITLFASGRRTKLVDGELVATHDTVGDASLPARQLESTAHGGYECFAARGADGMLRCFPPPERYLEEFFADPECTDPVESIYGDVLSVAVPGTCPPEIRIYERGVEHPGPVYARVDGSCTLAHDSPPGHSARSPYYEFPTEVPATEFTELFEVTR